MNTLYNKGFSGWAQLGVFLGLWGGAMIIGSLVSAGVWVAMTGQGIMNMPVDMMNPQYASAVKTVQAVSTLFIFFAPAVGYAFIVYRNGWQALGFSGHFHWKLLGLSILIIACSGPLIDSLSLANRAIPIPAGARAFFDKMEKDYEAQVKVIGNVSSVGQYILSLIMIALLPAFFEEVLFRGGMQNMFARWWKKPWVAIIVTSILFSAIHGSWYGFLPRIALGVLLGAIFYYSHNIWYSIAVHFLNNAIVVTYMYYNSVNHKPFEVSPTETTFPWWVGIISVVALVFLFRWFKKSIEGYPPPEVFYEANNPFDQRNQVA